MQILKKGYARQVVTGLMFLILMTGCAEWNSAPVVVEQNFGSAVNNMIKNQTLYPEHGQDDMPILTLDGQKAAEGIKAYRKPAKDPLEKSKTGVIFDVRNVGSD